MIRLIHSSPLGGEGAARSVADEGAASTNLFVASERVSGLPLIRAALRPTFSLEGRRMFGAL